MISFYCIIHILPCNYDANAVKSFFKNSIGFTLQSSNAAIIIQLYHAVTRNDLRPRWKINSFLSEISVCWNSAEKITIKIEKAFSVILRALPAIRSSFQPSPQQPTGPQQTSDLIHNWQLQMQDGVFQATPLLTVSPIRRLYRLYVDINVY